MQIYSSSSWRFFGAISGIAWLAIILAVMLTFATGQILPQQNNKAQYCSSSSGSSNGNGNVASGCVPAQVTEYGLPFRGQVVKVTEPLSTTSNFDSVTFAFNFAFYAICLYILFRILRAVIP